MNIIFFSPLEQFEILPLIPFIFYFFDFTLTNSSVILLIVVFFFITLFVTLLNRNSYTLFVVPNRWQSLLEIFYNFILSMVVENIGGKKSQQFFPLIFTIFFFIFSLNLAGLVPYSFTVTSHFVVTLTISLTIFLGINIISVKLHGLEFFSLFLPSGTPLLLAFLLVPIEFILYLFRPFSLAIRLFCNMMAGHTLLKIFAGFAWSLMSFPGILFFLHFIPLILLLPLLMLELGIVLVQAYVFSLLTCIYLNDAINLH